MSITKSNCLNRKNSTRQATSPTKRARTLLKKLSSCFSSEEKADVHYRNALMQATEIAATNFMAKNFHSIIQEGGAL